MKQLGAWAAVAAFTGFTMLAAGCAQGTMSKREARPEMKERFTQEAVNGQVTRTEGEYVWIREDGGKEVRAHIDDRTKMDKVTIGDRVRAYITEGGHATTVQRVE